MPCRPVLSSLVNTDLPNSAVGVPRALVAPFWTDLDLRTSRGQGRVYAWFDGSKLIVEWKDAVHYSGASPYTFQVLLWPSGLIEFQYLSLGSLTNLATVGLQDETGTIGLRVAYNVNFAHPGLRVRLSHLDDWLVLDRSSGSIAPGGRDTLRVTFNAHGYKDGEYAGEIRVASNDVHQPLFAVPCSLHVGTLSEPLSARRPASRRDCSRLRASPLRRLSVSARSAEKTAETRPSWAKSRRTEILPRLAGSRLI